MNDETKKEKHEKERASRDIHRRPRSRKHREIVLTSGERVKRTEIGWSEEQQDDEEPS